MHDPKDVFDNPDKYWDFLTSSQDDDFEGQYFDRKEACRLDNSGSVSTSALDKLQEHVQECLSAFANSRRPGGLLVLGIGKDGTVKGIKHLSEKQINRITNIRKLLKNQLTSQKSHSCLDETGTQNEIHLIYSPYVENGICETLENNPRAWERHGKQNILLDPDQRERLKRDKGLTRFEQEYCCPYDPNELDLSVLHDFRQSLSDTDLDYTNEQLLYQVGALDKKDGEFWFTNAGFLFFSNNPQRIFDWAKIRFLSFPKTINEQSERGLTTREEFFSGSLVKQIRRVREFIRESSFFKVYQKRSPTGEGFIEEPEYPSIAIDEAIVNAVIHRDYQTQLWILCEYYADAFVVRNPGRILQINIDVPETFSLEDVHLAHRTRNTKLFDWFLKMRNSEKQAEFVRGLGEGTQSMFREMEKLDLPAPVYENSHAQTILTLISNAPAREANYQNEFLEDATEFTNLFLVKPISTDGIPSQDTNFKRIEFLLALKDSLEGNGWFVDSLIYSRLIAHHRGLEISLPHKHIFRLYPAYSFELYRYWGEYYLAIDYTLVVKSVQRLNQLLSKLTKNDLTNIRGTVNWNDWQVCKIISITDERAKVYLYDYKEEVSVLISDVIPDLTIKSISEILRFDNISFDLNKAIKQHSLASKSGEARTRSERVNNTAKEIANRVFPIRVNDTDFHFTPKPTHLLRTKPRRGGLQYKILPEPQVIFDRHGETADIREGITKFGAYDTENKDVEIIPVCNAALYEQMQNLIHRLQNGQYRYRGSERTFHTRFIYNNIISVQSTIQALSECQRLINERPSWVGNPELNRIFLIHTPEAEYAIDDENSPYYQLKRLLLENGLPSQMVDTSTLLNPDWKDLNLALNIVAKCGVTPWVLSKGLPDADYFIGLSYTRSNKQGSTRLLGHANVFDPFGQWQFHSGNTQTFDYEKRTEHFHSLTKETLTRLSSRLNDTPSIYFHYSAKFSSDDRAAILDAAKSIRPNGKFTFVWINKGHNIRLYDSRPQTDGSLSRGSYVITSPYQVYLSTTGYNSFQKTLGTPAPLELNVWQYYPDGMPTAKPDLRSIALQVLSLTKLNWASTGALCAEPITTKYAGDIAYLTAAFLRQGNPLDLHKVLEETPWFI